MTCPPSMRWLLIGISSQTFSVGDFYGMKSLGTEKEDSNANP